jgi:hypothetical protein
MIKPPRPWSKFIEKPLRGHVIEPCEHLIQRFPSPQYFVTMQRNKWFLEMRSQLPLEGVNCCYKKCSENIELELERQVCSRQVLDELRQDVP